MSELKTISEMCKEVEEMIKNISFPIECFSFIAWTKEFGPITKRVKIKIELSNNRGEFKCSNQIIRDT